MDSGLLVILVAVLGFVAIAGVGFVFAGPSPNQARAAKRAQALTAASPDRETRVRRNQASAQDQRRRQIVQSLKEQDRRQRKARLGLEAQLRQAGLGENVKLFWIVSASLGVFITLGAIVLRQPIWVALGLGFAAAFGLPRWGVGFMAKRRIKMFVETFPDAIDIITRGIKSGLPVHECMRIIAKETPQPVAGEFALLMESISVGVPIDQALERMNDRIDAPEVRFFAIVLAIQSKTGGNLAEALANLSNVIRGRKLMREKIKAFSAEAVASAFIIGSLPPGVLAIITMISPDYTASMFNDPRGKLMLLVGGVWMAMGIFSMRRMINFKL